MDSKTENIAAKSFSIFLFTFITSLIFVGDGAWIIAIIISLGYALTKKTHNKKG